MRWASYIVDLLIRRRLAASTIPDDIREQLCTGREFQVSTAIDWNYEVRRKPIISEMRSFPHPICVVAGRTSAEFVDSLKEAAPQTKKQQHHNFCFYFF